MQNKIATTLLPAAFFLLLFVLLFLFRAYDDNSLFSWSWAFAHIDASRIYLILTAGLAIAFVLAQRHVPEHYQIMVLTILSFAAAVPFWSEPEVIVDASRYFTQAKHLEVYGIGYFLREWGRDIQAWTDLPLLPFLYGLIFKLFGESRTAVQVFTTALFSLTTVITALVGKKLWDRDTGFAAGLLLLGIPYLLTQVPLMLVDVATMFFVTLSLFAFLEALDRGSPAWTGLSIATIVLTVLSKYSAWFMLSVLVVALFVHYRQHSATGPPPALRRGLLILLAGAALTGVVLLLKFDVVREQIVLLREYQHPGLSRWRESLVSTFLYQTHPLITASALASVAVALRKRDLRHLIVFWLVLLVAVFSIGRIRYVLPLFPMITLMAAYGLQAVRRDELRRFIVYGTVASSVVIAIFAYLPFAKSMSAANLQHAGKYLDTLPQDEVEVITLPPADPVVNPAVSVPLLDLFTDKRIRYRERGNVTPRRDEIGRSSLRFTWEFRNPAYYAVSNAPAQDIPVVVLSNVSQGSLPQDVADRLDGYQLTRSYQMTEDLFRYNVGVRVYLKSRSLPERPRD